MLLGSDKHVACSCVFPPLSSSLTRHMAVNDDDPGYIDSRQLLLMNSANV